MMIVINTIILITNRPVGKQKENIFPEKLFLLLFGKFLPPDTHTHTLSPSKVKIEFFLLCSIYPMFACQFYREKQKITNKKCFAFTKNFYKYFFLLINKKNLTKTFFLNKKRTSGQLEKIFFIFIFISNSIFSYSEKTKNKKHSMILDQHIICFFVFVFRVLLNKMFEKFSVRGEKKKQKQQNSY